MNNQEMYPPQRYEASRQYNIDPREQLQGQEAWQDAVPGSVGQLPYGAGYSGSRPDMDWMSGGGEKLRTARPQTLQPWQWIVGAIIVFVGASIIWSLISALFGSLFTLLGIALVVIAVSQTSVRAITVPSRAFTLDGQGALLLHNPAGTVRIHGGMTSTIEVRATKYVNGWFASNEEGMIDFVQEGNTIRVSANKNFRWAPLGGLRNVNFDITIPQQCNIQIHSEAGSIHLEGVHGQVKATTNAGTLHVQDATLEGQSNLTTNAGTIHVQQAVLKGQANFQTNAGTVYFSGKLDPQGTYRLGTNMGTIDVVLPAAQSFILAASTDMGTVTNQFGNSIVGSAPHARLELKTNLGTVNVRQG